MTRKLVLPILLIIACLGCKKKQTDGTTTVINTQTDTTFGQPNNEHISVLTQHNDNTRAGLNNQETVLTTSNVNSKQFGKLFMLTVDDEVYAQPLVVSNLPIASGTHNVLFIATVNNTVYAFDADKGRLYWKKNFTELGMTVPNVGDMGSSWCNPYNNMTYDVGIIGTPVIDSVARTIYFVARSKNGASFHQYLHAVNIVTGAEQPRSPVEIQASVPGTGDGNVNGVVSFDALRNNQRQGLALVNGVVYISYSSHCDWNPYHGWILGYNSTTLQQQIVYNDTPNGEEGGIWESGMGIAADAQGSLYVVTGNGTVGKPIIYTILGNGTAESTYSSDATDPSGRAESAMKLTPSGGTLQISSYFTPNNYLDLNVNDLDYGVMGTMLIPNSNYYLTGAKNGEMYLLNKDDMGGYSAVYDHVQQIIPLTGSMHCQPAYYKGSSAEYAYVWAENDQLRAYSFDRGSNKFITTPTVSPYNGPTGQSGAVLSVSSNGTKDGTGILWAAYAISGDAEVLSSPGILRAFDANNVTKELWDSAQNAGDYIGNYAKFSPPTIANGHVYLATFSNRVIVYGLK